MLEEKRTGSNRNNGEIVSLDELVPKFHMLRKIDRAIDWTKIYPIVENKYSKIGRPSVDPVVLVKMVMLQHLYGLRSLRQTVAEIEVNVAYRWFIGYGLTERIPHFSTISYNFLHRFDSEMFEEIFTLVLNEGIDSGYVKPEVIWRLHHHGVFAGSVCTPRRVHFLGYPDGRQRNHRLFHPFCLPQRICGWHGRGYARYL